MPKRTSFFRLLTECGPLIVLAVAGIILFGVAGPASAQFFDFGFGRPQQRQPQRGYPGGGGGFFAPFNDNYYAPGPQRQQQQQEQAPRVDYSRAPAPVKRETPAERNVLVLGDAMADWLGYGLEDALSETPEFGVIRKHKTVSGLLKYQPKGEPSDWAAAAKAILATENPDVIVVMLGINDRIPIREPVVEKKADVKPDAKTGEKPGEKPGDKAKGAKKDARAKPGETDAAKPGDKPADSKAADTKSADPKTPDGKTADSKPSDSKPSDTEGAPDNDEDDQPPAAAPEKARSAGGMYDFREERWVELYAKKIEEMIAVLKSKGVPVLWVGLPAIRGTKATSDMLFLDALYRDGAGKAGITYVDVWDGFVDDGGRFAQQGPDFEGQTRRLRTNDGVFFTKAGARKLAHYAEREIRRVLATRGGPVALPSESFAPADSNIRPGESGRPLMGPVVPLVASSVGTDELLGGVGTRPASVDALAARTMVKGEPLAAPPGRADDFSWPRREVGTLSAPPNAPAVAGTAPGSGGGGGGSAASAQKPRPRRSQPAETYADTSRVPPGFVVRQQRQPGRDPRQQPNHGFQPFEFNLFGGRW